MFTPMLYLKADTEDIVLPAGTEKAFGTARHQRLTGSPPAA
jgi:hypothetical protein